MQAPRDQLPSPVEFIPAGSGLDEFEVENDNARRSGPPVRGMRAAEELRVFTVVEQYEPCDESRRDVETAVLPTRPREAIPGRRTSRRLLARLAIAVALVAIPTGTPVETEGLPAPLRVAVHTAPTAQLPAPAVGVPTVPATRPTADRVRRQPQPTSPPPTRTQTASASQMASLRDALASLNGPFMTFEHCEVRFASADRALARCEGTRNEANRGDASLQPRRVEWTLDFDRAGQRWLFVDSTAH